MNLLISSYETKFASRNISLDLQEAELAKLKVSDPGSHHMPLDARIIKYQDAVHDGKWRDPEQINLVGSIYAKPMYFYGSYVSLSLGEKIEYLENDVLNYYKCIISDLNDTIEVQKSEI